MNLLRNQAFFFLVFITFVTSLYSMVYDNRFFPLYAHRYARTNEKPSAFDFDLFLTTGHQAAEDSDENIGIPEVFGKYDLAKLANAIEELTGTNPLQAQFPSLMARDIPYALRGKIESQGVAFGYYQRLTENASIGATWFAMHAFSRIDFSLDSSNTLGLSADQIVALDQLRRNMQESVQLQAPVFSQGGFSDIDMFVRFGNIWEYKHKFRRIDAGVAAGLLIPSGLTRNPFNPASLPFGGDGYWGAYVAADLELEMKEDWIVGILARINKRGRKTKLQRIVLSGEQPLFGAAYGNVFINPGMTIIAAPYVRIEDIHDGLGVQANYTIIKHTEDTMTDARSVQTPTAEFKHSERVSDWSSEYLTLTGFYDFSRVRLNSFYAPVVQLMWDIPIQLFATERAVKNHRVSFGIHFTF